jgi:hypothetical protein
VSEQHDEQWPICKARFDRIDAGIEEIKELLTGGLDPRHPGLIAQVYSLNEHRRGIVKIGWLLLGMGLTALGTSVAALIRLLVMSKGAN